MTEEDFKDDQLISIKLPRSQYELLKTIIEREEAYNWFINRLRNNLVWVVAGGILTIFMLYDKIHLYMQGMVK